MKTRVSLSKWIRFLLVLIMATLGAQCDLLANLSASALERKPETNPSPKAISKMTSSLLFKCDGRMLQIARVQVGMIGVEVLKEVPVQSFRYGHDGDGWWSIRNSPRSNRFRIAEGKLLNYVQLKNGKTHINVYTRVQ